MLLKEFKIKQKNRKGDFFPPLILGSLDALLVGSLLSGLTGGKGVSKVGKETLRANKNF